MHKLTESLSCEWGPYGINVNGIATGGFPDAETNRIVELQKKWAEAQVPLGGRPGNLWEAGLEALFLASDASSFITGERLYLDGGLSRGMKSFF